MTRSTTIPVWPYCVLAANLLFLLGAANRSAAVDIPIFNAARIGFSAGQSRDIRQTVSFPEFGPNDRLTLDWDVLADRDPWDRSGSVHAILPNGGRVQLGKFITGFGGTTSHQHDVSDLASVLSGQTLQIEAHIDTWVADAWRLNATFQIEPDANPEPNPNWAAVAISRDPSYGASNSGEVRKRYIVNTPETMDQVTLKYFASGHHHTQTSASDEFNRRRHRLLIDGQQVWTGVPWRTDGPNFRNVNPTSGRWDGNGDGDTNDPYPIDYWSSDFPRSGWVPGDEVTPYEFDVSDWLGDSGQHAIDLIIEGVDINSYWRVSAYVAGTTAQTGRPSGDYNSDGRIDAADYTVWRDQLGIRGSGIPADGNNDGAVDSIDYDLWRAGYGANSDTAAAPEPASAVLLLIIAASRARLLKA